MPNLSRLCVQAVLRVLPALLARVSAGDRASLARAIMQDRGSPRTVALAQFCDNAVSAWKNRQYKVHLNGEEALLRRLARFRPRVLLDVGANVGEWSCAAARHLPEVTVHAFEIAPATAEMLRRAVPASVIVNGVGLGERVGDVMIYASSENHAATSTLREAIGIWAESHGIRTIDEIKAKILTGDLYMRDQGLQRIDLLKIDVEGAEFSVLRGFSDTFARGAIDLVQFEYGRINLATRNFLADFYEFFTGHGFVVGKLYPEGVAFTPYDIEDEDFAGPNFVACRTARADIIEALRCPPLRLA